MFEENDTDTLKHISRMQVSEFYATALIDAVARGDRTLEQNLRRAFLDAEQGADEHIYRFAAAYLGLWMSAKGLPPLDTVDQPLDPFVAALIGGGETIEAAYQTIRQIIEAEDVGITGLKEGLLERLNLARNQLEVITRLPAESSDDPFSPTL